MKKLIIVTVLIMLASCATVSQRTRPETGHFTQSSGSQSVLTEESHPGQTAGGRSDLLTEGSAGQPGMDIKAEPAGDSSSRDSMSNPVPEKTEDQDQLILATLWYQKSAEMRALYHQCFRNAESALVINLEKHGYSSASGGSFATEQGKSSGGSADGRGGSNGDLVPQAVKTKPAAVVLDIDETVLDNSPFQGWQVIEQKAYNNEDWHRWVELAQAKALPGAVEFTRFADSLGVEVFYVSNRTVPEMGQTITNMKAAGFVNADSTHMLLKSATSSKVERREQIENNYEIILLIGDNLADLNGIYETRSADYGFGDVDADRRLFGTRYIILPNPMYGNWLNDLLRNAPGNSEREKLVRLLETF